MSKKTKAGRGITYILAFLWIIATTVPLLLAVLSSFKDNTEIYLRPWQLPQSWAPVNYIRAIVMLELCAPLEIPFWYPF